MMHLDVQDAVLLPIVFILPCYLSAVRDADGSVAVPRGDAEGDDEPDSEGEALHARVPQPGGAVPPQGTLQEEPRQPIRGW